MKELKPELLEVLAAAAKGKNVDPEIIMESLKEALITAARKYTSIPKRFTVEQDEETGGLKVLLSVEVVEDYPDVPEDWTAEQVAKHDESYMLLDEAEDYNEDIQVGDMLEMEIPIDAFGRNAIQTAKQILMQKIRDAERNRILNNYKTKIGTLVSGIVQQFEKGNTYISLGTTEATLPKKNLIPRDRLKQGDTVTAYISDVIDTPKGAQVILSRTHNGFLVELFKREVPEIGDNTVEIRAVSRDPGSKAKIAVFTQDERIDPVGTCVGLRGVRVQPIVRELGNERIDIVTWSQDIKTFITRAFAPADVRGVYPVVGMRRVLVVIADENLSAAIGRQGQNIKLTSELVNRDIQIKSESEYNALSEEDRAALIEPNPKDKALVSDRHADVETLFKD